jgi:hypothetical protein
VFLLISWYSWRHARISLPNLENFICPWYLRLTVWSFCHVPAVISRELQERGLHACKARSRSYNSRQAKHFLKLSSINILSVQMKSSSQQYNQILCNCVCQIVKFSPWFNVDGRNPIKYLSSYPSRTRSDLTYSYRLLDMYSTFERELDHDIQRFFHWYVHALLTEWTGRLRWRNRRFHQISVGSSGVTSTACDTKRDFHSSAEASTGKAQSFTRRRRYKNQELQMLRRYDQRPAKNCGKLTTPKPLLRIGW